MLLLSAILARDCRYRLQLRRTGDRHHDARQKALGGIRHLAKNLARLILGICGNCKTQQCGHAQRDAILSHSLHPLRNSMRSHFGWLRLRTTDSKTFDCRKKGTGLVDQSQARTLALAQIRGAGSSTGPSKIRLRVSRCIDWRHLVPTEQHFTSLPFPAGSIEVCFSGRRAVAKR